MKHDLKMTVTLSLQVDDVLHVLAKPKPEVFFILHDSVPQNHLWMVKSVIIKEELLADKQAN